MSWDWIMSLDPHWFSTLFGWYVFASMFVSGITVIAIVSIYLKSKGYLENVNDSHIHDLAKFMFAIQYFLDLPLVLSVYVDLVCQHSGRSNLLHSSIPRLQITFL